MCVCQYTEWGISNPISRHMFTTQQQRCVLGRDATFEQLQQRLTSIYELLCPIFLHGLGFPEDIISEFDVTAHLVDGSLKVDEGQSTLALHRDPRAPLPALVCGPTVYSRDASGVWRPHCAGGSLVLMDGIVPLSYGPHAVCLIDGSFLHAVTLLRALKGQGNCAHTQFQRHSLIRFNRWKREKGMLAAWQCYDGRWREEWRDAIPRLHVDSPPTWKEVAGARVRKQRVRWIEEQ
jgi:hypothetical protein